MATSAKPWYRRPRPLLGLGVGALAVVTVIVVVTLLFGGGPGDSGGTTTSLAAAETTTLSQAAAATTTPSQVVVTTAARASTALNGWTNLDPAGDLPSERSHAAMVYDPAGGRLILFGGGTLTSAFNDTCAYDPAANTWTELRPSGDVPSARMGPSMVYDSGTGKMILFGGFDGAYVNDTWVYDPAANTWTELRPAGDLPSGRSDSSMVYDSGTGKVILFGGSDGGNQSNETWAYDPTANTWADLHPTGDEPSPRSDHSMAYVLESGEVILFGGLGDADLFDDTWAYDPTANTWTDLRVTGPSARCFSCMVYDPGIGKVILFGGFDGVENNDTWAYDPTAKTWTDLHPAGALPSGRSDHSMAYDSGTGRVILFGGDASGSSFNDTWAFQGG